MISRGPRGAVTLSSAFNLVFLLLCVLTLKLCLTWTADNGIARASTSRPPPSFFPQAAQTQLSVKELPSQRVLLETVEEGDSALLSRRRYPLGAVASEELRQRNCQTCAINSSLCASPLWCSPVVEQVELNPSTPQNGATCRDLAPLFAPAVDQGGDQRKRLALVIPFQSDRWAQIELWLLSWAKDPEHPPCAAALLSEEESAKQSKSVLASFNDRLRFLGGGSRAYKPSDVELVLMSGSTFIEAQQVISALLEVPSLRQCFGKIRFVEVSDETDALQRQQWPGAMFFEIHQNPELVRSFQYIFTMENDVSPVRANWLQRIYFETYDASLFWVKGSMALSSLSSDSIEPRVTQEFTLWPNFFHINRNALYHLADSNWRHFAANVSHNRIQAETAISETIFGRHCATKLLLQFYRHSTFILDSPMPYSSRYSPDTVLVRQLVSAPQCLDVPMSLASSGNAAIGNGSDWQAGQKLCDAQLFPALPHGQEELKNLPLVSASKVEVGDPARPTIPHLVVVIPTTKRQVDELRSTVNSWRADNHFPCGSDEVKRFTTLAIQGRSEVVLPLVAFLQVSRNPALENCFGDIVAFVADIPQHLDEESHGPATRFYQALFSPQISAKYDYMMLIQPDVEVIRRNWIEAIHRELRDENDFWVKGSLLMHSSASDGIGGISENWQQAPFFPATTNERSARRREPIGSHVLHISGNALYNLWDARFKSVLLDAGLQYADRHELPYERSDRLQCMPFPKDRSGLPYVCHGSFDSSIAEYLYSSRRRARLYLPKYQAHSFILNGLHCADLGIAQPLELSATYLMHQTRCEVEVAK